jgi:hypothetical protein
MQATYDVVRRALRAYWRRPNGLNQDILANYSGVESVGDRSYVVLKNVNGVLAVYRIRPSGRLAEMLDWPSELEVW